MKTAVVLLAMTLAPCVFAQTKALPTNLSDTFAKAAIKALRAIDGDIMGPSIDGDKILVNRRTQKAIDDVDSEARSKG